MKKEYYEIKEDGKICAFAIVEDFAIRLLCVTPSKQCRGIGTGLIEQIEKEARDREFDKLITGGVSSKIFIGAPSESWTQYFTKPGNIYVGKVQGEIASFCMVDTNCQNYLTDKYGKVGMPGCVGTVPKFRDKGIALEMVARATRYLKTQGMDVSFIYFTGVPKWYEKIGYRTFLIECFGTKQL